MYARNIATDKKNEILIILISLHYHPYHLLSIYHVTYFLLVLISLTVLGGRGHLLGSSSSSSSIGSRSRSPLPTEPTRLMAPPLPSPSPLPLPMVGCWFWLGFGVGVEVGSGMSVSMGGGVWVGNPGWCWCHALSAVPPFCCDFAVATVATALGCDVASCELPPVAPLPPTPPAPLPLLQTVDNNVNRSYGLLKIRVTKDVSTSIYMQIAVVIAILFSMFFIFSFPPCVLCFSYCAFCATSNCSCIGACSLELGVWRLEFGAPSLELGNVEKPSWKRELLYLHLINPITVR